MAMPNHPGTMQMIDMFTKEVRTVPIDQVPEGQRFVFMNGGVEVPDADGATQIVPIVETRMFPLDAQGRLVEKAKAKLIRISEFGPEGRLLRSTVMVPK